MENTTKEYACDKGTIKYRTNVTAGDEFSFTFVRMEVQKLGGDMMAAEKIGRWVLNTFALEMSYKNAAGETVVISPFTWEMLNVLPREVAADGWIVNAAMAIYKDVWALSDAEVAETKKA